jgi:5-methylcytosine-specific restriction endonuclease McrBC GTP-binding regulatory subunit McrB
MEAIRQVHIRQAIQEIDDTGRSDRTSFKFELLFEDRKYPPLLVVAIANRFAGGTELPPNSSSGGWKSEEFVLLKKYGFRVVEKVKDHEKLVLSTELSRIASKQETEIFFQLLLVLLREADIYSDDERLAVTLRESGENRISVNINARLVLSLHKTNGVSLISFMIPDAIADLHAKEWVGEKWRFKGGDDMVSVDFKAHECDDLSKSFKNGWIEACKNYLPSQQKSQYRKHHHECLYRLAFDTVLRNNLFLNRSLTTDPTTMNYQETIQLYPIAEQFHDYMTQFHKTPGTPKEYVSWLNKVSVWFKKNSIVNKSFDIWSDTIQIDAIERNLKAVSKAKWKKLNSDNNNWYSAPWNKWVKFNKDVIGSDSLPKIDFESDDKFDCDVFHKALLSAPLSVQESLSYRFSASLLAKRFLILTGLSGSGKTKLAQSFVRWISADESQYLILPVAADWTNREPLFGYPNALNKKEYVQPESGVLSLILRAQAKENIPHFLILDEMNLSHVERYFADFLSGLESDEAIPLHKNPQIMDVPQKVRLPKNLFVIGTVNIDETTYMFSPKVLDRANVIEFRVSDIEISKFLANPVKPDLEQLDQKGASMGASFAEMASRKQLPYKEVKELNEALMSFFNQLKLSGAEFGYRTAHEIHRLAGALQTLKPDMKVNDVIDISIMQKLLPKVHGSRKKMVDILKAMSRFCVEDGSEIETFLDTKNYEAPADIKYPMSLEKLHRMYRGAIENGFTSFAEA